MQRAYYSNTIEKFLNDESDVILGQLVRQSEFAVEQLQRDTWLFQIAQLTAMLKGFSGSIYFEYAIPRMGKRVDVVLIIGAAIFVVEFKVGESRFLPSNIDQVVDYALDLKNFHEPSHNRFIAPILIATQAPSQSISVGLTHHDDKLFAPILSNGESLRDCIRHVHEFIGEVSPINSSAWECGRYLPTPTIIEAATALYNGHSVSDIARSDADGAALQRTTQSICSLITDARANSYKAVCFVTGVPGAGKTLIGLNVATEHLDKDKDMYSVFLSGNGPLVRILQEALARDKLAREKTAGRSIKKQVARSEVKMFIQNVHHYRDECLRDSNPPIDHVAVFDEAQRAWNRDQTTKFMRQKKGQLNFDQSEPEFLLSCVDRHPDWGVVVCLVGGGQEINTGEAGISEWITAVNQRFSHWHVHISDRLKDAEFGAGDALSSLSSRRNVHYDSQYHLSVSMRSFRAEHVSHLVKQLLDLDKEGAKETLRTLADRYPIVITRDLAKAKDWIRQKARGSERYGIVVSSTAMRLKPLAIDVRLKPEPIHWFLAPKDDVRSSFYLEDVSTEFDIQGLELDWVCVTWDGDFRYAPTGWRHHSFRGKNWQRINSPDRQLFQKNAYRVLLTRARQGMVIVVPQGDPADPTRDPNYYDPTFEYLKTLNFQVLD